MRIVHESAVPEEHRVSPKGRFEIHRRHVSLALGGIKDTGEWGGGHPFDVELVRLPPGRRNFPAHSHAAQTEYYLVVSGDGQALDAVGSAQAIRAGDHFIVLPGEVHQLHNTGTTDLVYYVIADHHRADVTSYPATGKRQIKPEMRVVALTDAAYYEGEE
jgi:uncharacterized cupin superfamily protein